MLNTLLPQATVQKAHELVLLCTPSEEADLTAWLTNQIDSADVEGIEEEYTNKDGFDTEAYYNHVYPQVKEYIFGRVTYSGENWIYAQQTIIF